MKESIEPPCRIQGFTLMEVSLSVGIAATWILLSLGLIGSLIEQVQRNRQSPVQVRPELQEEKAPVQFKMPRTEIDEGAEED